MPKQAYKVYDRKTVGQSHIYLDQLPREADGIHNMDFDNNGRLVKRLGFTKHNTTSLSAATTVDAESTAKVLNVTATTGFVVGDSVIINTDGVREETKVIASIQEDISLTMTENLTYTHPAPDAVEALFKITGLYRFYKVDTSTKYTLAMCDTILYKLANTTDWDGTSIKTGLTTGANMHFSAFSNRCYMCNDENGLFKFGIDTAAVRTVGVTVPYTKPGEAVVGSGGHLGIGDYYFCYTYVDEDGYEGNPSAVSDVSKTTVEDSSVTITIKNSSDEKITKRRVYRTSVGGAIYYYDGDVEFLLSTGWTSTGWTGSWAAGWKHTTGNVTALSQSKAAVDTTEYFITYTVTGRTAGTFVIAFGGESKTDISASGVWEPTASSTDNLVITPSTDFDGKIVISINDTTFISSQADGTLGTQVAINHTIPPTSPQVLVKRDNRIFLGDDADLCISHISDVEYFPAAWFQQTPDRRKITGLVEQGRNLIIFTEDTVSILTGQDEDNFQFRKSFAGDGCIATRSIQNIKGYIIFLGFEGIMAFNGSNIAEVDEKLCKYLRDNINYTYAGDSCSFYYEGRYYLSYPTNASHALGESTVPNETVYFDYKTGKTGVYSFAFNVFSRWDKGSDGILIKGGSTTIGRVYNLFTGLDDDGSAIECYDRTMSLDFGIPEVEKNYYDIYVKVKTKTGTTLRVYYTIDDNDETHTEPITGEGLVADKERWYRVRLPSSTRGRSIAIRPWMEDKYQAEFQGYIIIYDTEALRV